jgi:hypothetical protein
MLLNYEILGWAKERNSVTTALLPIFSIFHQLYQQLVRYSMSTLNSYYYLTSLSDVLGFQLNIMAELYWLRNPLMTDVSNARKFMPFGPGNRICSVRMWLLMVENFSRYWTLYWSKKFLRTSPITGTDCAHIFHNVMDNIAAEKATESPANIRNVNRLWSLNREDHCSLQSTKLKACHSAFLHLSQLRVERNWRIV